ncbi:uncharacterized protein LOC125027380 [Penaeus chinensis]|uniref:uncharacterized protein LOC125027380 n=1 Tax=Penaeus chinensis TaxID=139456 RepID=UPI001FB84D41|nr:uncharacterized protein LOC125027380 [Penaeus chinensis]
MGLRCAPILAFFIVNLDSPLTQCAVFRISKGEWKSYGPVSIKANVGNATILDRKPKQDPRQIPPENKPLVIAISTIAGVILLCLIVFSVWYLWKWRKVKQAEKQTLDRNSTVTYHRYDSSIERLPGSVKRPDQEITSAYAPSGYKYNPPQRFEKYTPRERGASNRRRSPPRPPRQRRNSDPHMTWSRARDLDLPESRWQINKGHYAKRELWGRRPYRRSIMSDVGPAYNEAHRRHETRNTPLWYERLSRPPDYYSREVLARSRRPGASWYSECDFPLRSSRRSSPPYGRYNEY